MLDNYIDFDEASREWRKNKKTLPNGRFEYICNYIHTNGKQCRKTILSCQVKNCYIYGFGDNIPIDKYNRRRIRPKGYKFHPNRDYYCRRSHACTFGAVKKHINRYRCNPMI